MLLPPAATRLIIVLVVLAVRNLPGRLATALARSLLHVGCTGYRVLIDRFARSALSAWELDCHALVDHHIAGQPPSWVIREYPLITGPVSPVGHVAGTRGSMWHWAILAKAIGWALLTAMRCGRATTG